MSRILPYLSVLAGLLWGQSLGFITVQKFDNQTASRIAIFDDKPAGWGASLYDKTYVGKFAAADPQDGCSELRKSRPFSCFALIRRGNCNFDEKALNAQKAGFQAAVIYNNKDDKLVEMAGGQFSHQVKIPAVFIGLEDGIYINSTFLYTIDDNVTIIIDGKSDDNWLDKYVWPFLGSVVFIFLILATFSVYKWFVDRRRRRRNRLSTKKLKKIPLKKFVKGDPYDVCAICLEEYEEQDELRVLPCNHAYHAACIDPWLTKNKRQCPVCKRKVNPGSENSSQASVPVHVENSPPDGPSTETSRDPDDITATTEDEEEEAGAEEQAGAEQQEADGEHTPLILRSQEEGVAIRDRSLLTRIRDALSSWSEGRRRHSSLVVPTPIDPASNPAVFAGYGSISEVPTEFNPTLPPPPARSLRSGSAGDAAVGSAVN